LIYVVNKTRATPVIQTKTKQVASHSFKLSRHKTMHLSSVQTNDRKRKFLISHACYLDRGNQKQSDNFNQKWTCIILHIQEQTH